MQSPKNCKVILGITGGIAAYKSCELIRLFKKAGCEVRVVMTAAAEQFITPLTLQTLSGYPVLRSLHAGVPDLSATSHIDLAQWGDIFVIAPATANFIAKYAQGICDDALLTEALAFQGPVLLAPAMNTRMWQAEVTQENCKKLQNRGVVFVGPEAGDLACGEVGLGKMSEPQAIFKRYGLLFCTGSAAITAPHLQKSRPYLVLITSGPTRSYIDEIRFITNKSSGKMGHAMAQAAEASGAKVILITGPVEDKYARLEKGEVFRVETAQEMDKLVKLFAPKANIIIAAAAVSDFEVEKQQGKIRRENKLDLELKASRDILGDLGKKKLEGQVFIGFAAEWGEGKAELEHAKGKLFRKNLDFLVFNNVARTDIGFDSDDNEGLLLERYGDKIIEHVLPKAKKIQLAQQVLQQAYKKIQGLTERPMEQTIDNR